MIGAGSLAGIPVWTGGSTAYTATPLPPAGGEQLTLTPTTTQIDLHDGELLVSAAVTGVAPLQTLSAAEVDAMIAELATG